MKMDDTSDSLDLLDLKSGEINFKGQYAGFASRFLAFMIDFLILSVVVMITGLLVSQLVQISVFFLNLFFSINFEVPENFEFLLYVITLVAVYAIYYLFFWSFIGTTIGGIIMGIRMVSVRGVKPSFYRCVIRFCMEFVLLPLLVIGSIWIFISPRRQAWYDKVAGIFVIYDWKARPEERFWKRPKTVKYLEGKTNG